MITRHSIDLKMIEEPCFALTRGGDCSILIYKSEVCSTFRCPFYKPANCKTWVRIEDRQGINLIPPEELRETGRREK